MKYLFSCLLLSMLCIISVTQSVKEVPIKNPMLWADVPDSDVIRVGDTFYLVSTTIHLMPGALVMASKDLKNWKTVGYISDKLIDSPEYDLSFSLPLDQQKGESVGTIYGRGQWATSLKFHNGKFWALLALSEQGAMGDTYIFTAPKTKGPWTIHTRMRHFHDATLFFDDDDTPYVFFGTGKICQLTLDLKGAVKGSLRHCSQREKEETGLLESTRVIKHRGTYYAMLISQAYSSGLNRREVRYRTKNSNGEWEKHVILESDLGGFRHLAQGTIVDAKEGDWCGIMFQDRGGAGCVLTLSPIRWIDGWPMLGDENYKVSEIMRPYKSGQPATGIVLPDDFDDTRLGLHWQWGHNPVDQIWNPIEHPGLLRLKTSRVVSSLYLAPNALTQRMEGPACNGYICMNLSKMKGGDCAGLTAFNDDSGVLTVKKSGKKLMLEMSEQKVTLTECEKAVTNVDEKIIETADITKLVNAKQPKIWLHLDGEFRPGQRGGRDAASFFYSFGGGQWMQIGTKDHRMVSDYRRFLMGTKFGIFNYTTKKTGGYVDVDLFKYQCEEK